MPIEPPIMNMIWLIPLIPIVFILSASCSDESCVPFISRVIIYESSFMYLSMRELSFSSIMSS